MSENPLSTLYRSKSNYIQLPSRGKFYTSGIKLSIDNELGVMPMTIKDEIELKSPDSLFNSSALLTVITNCVPDIKNSSEIPVCDIDSILFGIKAASDSNMEIEVVCPTCKEHNNYNLNINHYLAKTEKIPEDNTISYNESVIYIKPHTLETMSKQKIQDFKIQQMQNKLKQKMLNQDSETLKEITDSLRELYLESTEITIDIMVDNIYKVTIPSKNIEVLDRDQIKEWTLNIDRELVKKINKKIQSLNGSGMDKEIKVTCDKCNSEYITELEINPVNFFTNE